MRTKREKREVVVFAVFFKCELLHDLETKRDVVPMTSREEVDFEGWGVDGCDFDF